MFANSSKSDSLFTLQELQARSATMSALSPLQFVLEQLPTTDVLSLISRFHRHGYDLNEEWSRFTCGRPLQHCCANAKDPGKLRAAFLLLDLGANPSLPERPYKSNIVRAMENEAWNLYDRLLHHSATGVNDRDDQNRSLLHYLVAVGSMAKISELIDTLHDVDVNIQDSDGNTPLHMAIYADRTEVVRKLLRVPGIRLEFTDRSGRTPLATATYWGMTTMALVLIEHPGAFTVVANDRSSPLLAAAIHGNQALCARLLDACHYKNIASQKDLSGKSILHHLAKNEWSTMITTCIQLAHPPMSADAIDHAGRSPLHYAALLGNMESCKALIDAGANLKLQDRLGMTAAHVAADSGFKDALMILLRTGNVDANQRDHLGRNLVHWAATLDCLELMHELSRKTGIRWEQKDKYGKRPVDIAYICESKYVGQFLARRTRNAPQYDWTSMYNSPFVDPPPDTDVFEPHIFGMSVEVEEVIDTNPKYHKSSIDPKTLPIIRSEHSWYFHMERRLRLPDRSVSLNRELSRYDREHRHLRSGRSRSLSIYRGSATWLWDLGMRWNMRMCWERSQTRSSSRQRRMRSRRENRNTSTERLHPKLKRSKSMEEIVDWSGNWYDLQRHFGHRAMETDKRERRGRTRTRTERRAHVVAKGDFEG